MPTLEMRATNRGITIHELFEQTCRGCGRRTATRQVVLNCCPTPSSSPPGAKSAQGRLDRSAGNISASRTTARESGRRNSGRAARSASTTPSVRRTGRGAWPADRQELIDLHGGTFTLKSKLRIGTSDRPSHPGVKSGGAAQRKSTRSSRSGRPPPRRDAHGTPVARGQRREGIMSALRKAATLRQGGAWPTRHRSTPRARRLRDRSASGLCIGCGRSMQEIGRWAACRAGAACHHGTLEERRRAAGLPDDPFQDDVGDEPDASR